MRAHHVSTLLLAGLLLVLACSAAPHPTAADKAKSPKTKPKPAAMERHKHIPRMDVQQQKYQSLQQEPEQQNKASIQQVLLPGPLHPDCVPKYVTDLVVPPPMPIVAPLVAEGENEQSADGQQEEGQVSGDFVGIASVDARPTAADRKKKKVVFETDEWEFKSEVRERERELALQAEARKAAKRAKDRGPNDDFYESVGLIDKEATTGDDAAPNPEVQQQLRDSIKSDYPTLDEEMNEAEFRQRWKRDYPKKYPTQPPTNPPPVTPNPPPVVPPPVVPDPVVPPPVVPPPVVPDPVVPPPVVPPPVVPPPVVPDPVVPPPVVPPPVVPDPVVPPPVVTPPPVVPSPVVPPPVVPPPVVPPPVVPPPVVPPPVVPPPVIPPPVVPPPVIPPPIIDNYEVSVRQIPQSVLPPAPNVVPTITCPASFGPTNVLAYGPSNIPGQLFHNWPGFTIEAQRNVPTRVTWTNDLKDAAGNYLPHILRDSIDQTLHWANPAALGGMLDSNPCHTCTMTGGNCALDPACVTAATTTYTGPVPTVTHVHGQASVYDWADGYTEAWFLPNAANLAGFSPVGTWYNQMQQQYTTVTGQTWAPGSSVGIYRNTQRPTSLWYHDHTLGLTRTNVFAGMAGFYLVRERFPSLANGPELPGIPYPAFDGIIPIGQVRELPLAIQDRSFTDDSQLWYPVASNPPADVIPNGPLHPRWIPEYSATVVNPITGVPVNYVMMTVNGRTYPRHTVYPDAYRLRILNGCNSRTLQLKFARSDLPSINPLLPSASVNLVPFYVIGNEGGWFPELQAPVTTLQMGPAERYDVIIDFSGLLPGQFVYMLNNGPETDTAIYDGTNNGLGLTQHTAQIMRFDVTAPVPGVQAAVPFNLAQQTALDAALRAHWAANVPALLPNPLTREVALLEEKSPAGFPISVLLGSVGANGLAVPNLWMDPVTTDVPLGAGQYWDIINLSVDSHPIHLHNVDFEYLGRFAITVNPAQPGSFTKTTTPMLNPDLDPLLEMPCATSPTGRCSVPKDTIIVLPNSYTRIGFNTPLETGLYVWHCHLVEHEDNEMMLPFCFGQPGYPDPKRPGALMCPGAK